MNILMSYAFSRSPGWPWCLRQIKDNGARILIDSGAFTAHHAGIKVTLEGYAAFLRKNIGAVDEYIALDVLGDKAATLATYRQMLKHKLRPMGVVTTDMTAEEAMPYLDDNPRICVAGGSWGQAALSWYPHKLELINRLSGGRAKTHALGFTPNGFDGKTPIFSSDSSSWTSALRFGTVNWWNGRANQPEQSKWKDFVSHDASDAAKDALRSSNIPANVDPFKLNRGGNSLAANITALGWLRRAAFAEQAHGVRLYLAVIQTPDLGLILQAMRHGNRHGGINFEAVLAERRQVINGLTKGTQFGRRYIQQAIDNYRANILPAVMQPSEV